MSAPTARAILHQLDARRLGAQMAALAALDTEHQAEVRDALAAVKGSARIDVPKLIESVHRSIAERAARRPPDAAWRYAIYLMDEGQIEQFRQLVASGTDPDTAASQAMQGGRASSAHACTAVVDAKPDEDHDDDAPRRRRSLPRRRQRRAERAADDVPARAGTVTTARRQSGVNGLENRSAKHKFVHGRSFGPGDPDRRFGESIDYDPHARSFAPPWLLEGGGEDELDEETDDEPDETRVNAQN